MCMKNRDFSYYPGSLRPDGYVMVEVVSMAEHVFFDLSPIQRNPMTYPMRSPMRSEKHINYVQGLIEVLTFNTKQFLHL